MAAINRTYHKHCTAGEWYLPDGQLIYTLELPWRNNEINSDWRKASCIPEGQYIVDRDHTGKHRWYKFRNEETAPRTHIEIHRASLLRHLQGCIAPCLDIKGGPMTSEPVAVDSLRACELLLKWYGEDSFVLEITS